MREKFRYLFKNAGLLMIGNFSSKILVFLLVPIYTRILSTAEYGSYDLLYTTALMLLPILSLNIIDAVMRFSFNESRENQREIFSIGFKYIIASCVLLTLGTLIISKVFHYEMINLYYIEFIFLYISYAFNQFIIQFARGIDDIIGISIAGVIGTVIMILGNLYFLLITKSGLKGYFLAYIISFFVPTIFLIIKNRMYLYFTKKISIFHISAKEREMLIYSIPLIFTTLSWYINSVSDRYVVTFFCGIDANGLYSIAYKLPAILNAVQTIFIQAWQISAIKEFGDSDGDRFYRSTYEGCHIVMVILCSSLVLLTRFLAKLLFANDFFVAWKFVPTLLLYIVFNTLSGTLGGVFSASKDTKIFAKTAIIGAGINIVLNLILVFLWGPEGAAIATVISSIVIWRMRLKYSKKYIDWKINFKKHYFEYFLLLIQVFTMTIISDAKVYVVQIMIWLLLILINLKKILIVRK